MIKSDVVRLLDKILIPSEWGNKGPKMTFIFLIIHTLDLYGFCLKVDQFQYQYNILILNTKINILTAVLTL